jgi:alpha-N-arabinofuranosidase
MDENHHYDLALVKNGETYRVILKLNIGDIKYEKAAVSVSCNEALLKIVSDAMNYKFFCIEDGKETMLGTAQTKYLSSEVAGGFTGVVLGLYSQDGGNNFNEFTDFRCNYSF